MGHLAASGHTISLNPREAEIIIVNTCAFIKTARDEAEKVIGEMAAWKKKGKCKKLYVAGCLPKYLGIKNKRIKMDGVNSFVDSIKLYDSRSPRVKATRPWTAYVKISEGCDNDCSYCLIPKIRGRRVSRKPEDILKEVKMLAKKGVKEIIYIAQDTTAYPDLPGLLRKTAAVIGVEWIRIMYAHPKHVTDALIDAIAKEQKILKYIDLPMQHASDKILRSMNRKYSKNDLTRLVSKLRKTVPGICIRTTFIAGFPGETEKDFNELRGFIKKMGFDRVGVFPYSREEGTSAAKMENQVPEKIKNTRVRKLMQMQEGISRKINKAFIGRTVKVIIENHGKEYFVGRSFRDAPEIDGKVLVRAKRRLRSGDIAEARITSANAHDLTGSSDF